MYSFLLLDGGMGRELLRRGAPFRQPEWSALALIEAPDHVTYVHDDFIQSGADMITTNSYALVPFHIGEQRFAEDGARLIELAGQLARDSANRAGRRIVVAGSLPPVMGSYRPDLFDRKKAMPLLRTLIEGLAPYVDVWLAETQSSIEEVETIREVLSEVLPEDTRPLWLAYTLDDLHQVTDILAGHIEPVLRSGQNLRSAVRAACDLDIDVLLFNCSQAELMEPAIRAARDELQGTALANHIGAYANAFAPVSDNEQKPAANEGLSGLRKDLDPSEYTALAESWVAAGARYIGGCCGIGSEHIAELDRLRTQTMEEADSQ